MEQVRQIAFELPEEDRLELAHSLWESVASDVYVATDAEIDTAWEPEIARRVAEIKAGTAITFSREEVEADLRAIVGA